MADKLTVREVVALSLQTWGDGQSDAFGASAGVKAACVCLAESGGNPAARNSTYVDGGCKGAGSHHASGLWQIIPACHPAYPEAELFTATGNAKAAYAISKQGTDWGPWSTGSSRGNPNKGAWTAKKPQVMTAVNQLYEEERSGGQGIAGVLEDAIKRGVLGPLGAAVVTRAPDAIGGVVDAAQAAIATAQALADLGQFISDPGNWRRVLLVTSGLGLVIIGTVWLARDSIARGAAAYVTGGKSEAVRPEPTGGPDGQA